VRPLEARVPLAGFLALWEAGEETAVLPCHVRGGGRGVSGMVDVHRGVVLRSGVASLGGLRRVGRWAASVRDCGLSALAQESPQSGDSLPQEFSLLDRSFPEHHLGMTNCFSLLNSQLAEQDKGVLACHDLHSVLSVGLQQKLNSCWGEQLSNVVDGGCVRRLRFAPPHRQTTPLRCPSTATVPLPATARSSRPPPSA